MINKRVKLLEKENLKVALNHQDKLKAKFGERAGTSGGTNDYDLLIHKPQINGNELRGDQTLVALGLLNNLLAGTGIVIEVEDGKIKISANGLAEVQFADILGEPRDNEKIAELVSALEYAKLSKIDTGYHEKRLYAVDENGEQIMVAWSELPQGSGTPDNYCKSVEIGDNSITFRLVVDGTEIERVFNVNLDRYATIEYVDNAIATSTGRLIGNFPTYADLMSYITTDLHNNDYAVVLADETHENQCWRYKWVVDGETAEWRAEWKISDTPLTEEQIQAINSTITLQKVQMYDNHLHDTDIHLSSEDREKLREVDNKLDKRGDTMTGSLNMENDDIVFKSLDGSVPLGVRWFLNNDEKASLYYDYSIDQLMLVLNQTSVLRFPTFSGDKTIATLDDILGEAITLDGFEDKGTGQLTQEQGEILMRSIGNFIILNDKFLCKLQKFDYDEYTAYYVCNFGGSYASINVNMETGAFVVYIKEMQRKLIAGQNITITYDEDGNPTISATGSGGTTDYNELSHKPSINEIELRGNVSSRDLGINYNDLNNKPTIPTKTSQLQNDSGFLTEHQSLFAYRTAQAQDEIDRNKEDSSNKTDTIEESSTKYPSCNAVIEYIAQLNGDNDEF